MRRIHSLWRSRPWVARSHWKNGLSAEVALFDTLTDLKRAGR